jgi:hypothetical protein
VKVSRVLKRLLLGALALLLLAVLVVVIEGWRAFGHRAEGPRLARMRRSPEWHDDHFENPEPLVNDLLGSLTGSWHASAYARPSAPPATQRVDREQFAKPPASGLRITWFGHAALLIEIDGARILTDPIWSERSSPLPWIDPSAGIHRRSHCATCQRSTRW